MRNHQLDALEKTFKELKKIPEYTKISGFLDSTRTNIRVAGLPSGASSFLLAALQSDKPKDYLIITSDTERAEELSDDLSFFNVEGAIEFPQSDILPYDEEKIHMEVASKRLDTFEALLAKRKKTGKQKPSVLITTINALLEKIPPISYIEKNYIKLAFGDKHEISDLTNKLAVAGYDRTSQVESRGEFGIRGGIVDIFPINFENPIRIDFFGDEIESIKYFDISTQRSIKSNNAIEEIFIPPVDIIGMNKTLAGESANLLPLTDIITSDTVIIIDNATHFKETAGAFIKLVEDRFKKFSETDNTAPPPSALYSTLKEIEESLARFKTIEIVPLKISGEKEILDFGASDFYSMKPSLEQFISLLTKRQKENCLIHIICDNDGQVQRLDEIFREHEMASIPLYLNKDNTDYKMYLQDTVSATPDILISVGDLYNGFSMPKAHILFLTDREIFGRYKKRHIYKKIFKGSPIKSASEIQRGDYVVHVEHGIGKFLGIRHQNIDGATIAMFEIEYKDGDKLLVPVESIKYVQKYSGVEGVKPELDRLGSKKWVQRKAKSQEAIELMAQELLQIYAKREIAFRTPYSPDTIWQAEFEAGFIYKETPDQMKAIDAVKDDMTSEKPMDRLVCGDVGYGKTEVAIRAAFKAVMDRKQVAVLAPTTILAQQHYNTFKERFASFPSVKIEVLSRFKKHAEQIVAIKKLKEGNIDVIIGTHRLLSQDVSFKNLSLLIIDEEQRFGVKHKEKLKELRASVDVLTLTATPIPRTLYLALSGLRDLSVIETPPPDRLPIKTKVIYFKDDQIKEAILRELNRGGQIYFVHNRIFNIHDVASKLSKIVPSASIAVSHGRMTPVELEKVMTDFVIGKYDILLSTTIIENGLDIPNVNTIIINRADALGLAQLYQLRGRVGRSSTQAYAYMIIPHGQAITETAVKRIQTIEEFTDLGVGFQIAMRDMEIRGTGNILGKEQHGCILSIGFELYCQLLEEAVNRLKGIHVEELKPVDLKWRCDSFIPGEYIPIEAQRVAFYKQIAEAASLEEMFEIVEELKDRYGDMPNPLENLIELKKLSLSAGKSGFYKIARTPSGFKFFVEDNIKAIISKCEGIIKKLNHITNIRFEDDMSVKVIWNFTDDTAEKDKIILAREMFDLLR